MAIVEVDAGSVTSDDNRLGASSVESSHVQASSVVRDVMVTKPPKVTSSGARMVKR